MENTYKDTYISDNSYQNYQDNSKTESSYTENSISKTKIININDFIFRQNLEFYPNLNGLSCKENVLTFKENGNIIRSETITFDLRTLPGQVWLKTPKEFLEVIRLNKECENLDKFLKLLKSYIPNNFINEGSEV